LNYSQIFAVGDIHGCKNLLDKIHNKIRIATNTKSGKKLIIYLGDYIDRGPDVKGTIDTLINFNLPNVEKIFLLGNHEQMFLDVLEEKNNSLYNWISNSGLETIESYGGDLSKYIDDNLELTFEKKIVTKIKKFLPKAHLNFFNNLKLYHVWNNYLFVHAGINPNFPIEKQQKETLIWTREKSFFDPLMTYDKIVVHGHTAKEKIEKYPFRINLDTGSFYSGRLSCLLLENNKCKYFDSL